MSRALLGISALSIFVAIVGLLMHAERKPMPQMLRSRRGIDAPNRVVVFGDDGPMTAAMIEELEQSPAVTDLLLVQLSYNGQTKNSTASPGNLQLSYSQLAKTCADREGDQSALIAACRAANKGLLDKLHGRQAAFFVHTTGSLSVLSRAAKFKRSSVFGPRGGTDLTPWRSNPKKGGGTALWNAFTLHHRTELFPSMLAKLWDVAKQTLRGLPIDDQVSCQHVARGMWVETAWVPNSECDEYANDEMLAISELLPRDVTRPMEEESANSQDNSM